MTLDIRRRRDRRRARRVRRVLIDGVVHAHVIKVDARRRWALAYRLRDGRLFYDHATRSAATEVLRGRIRLDCR